MVKSISWIGKSGQTLELKASCEIKMVDTIIYADGWNIPSGKELSETGEIIAYIDGVIVERCYSLYGWEIVDTATKDLKRISGIKKIGFWIEQAEKIEEFLKAVIEEGTTQEARDFKEQKKAKQLQKYREYAEQIIERAKTTYKNADGSLMTERQAREWQRKYNNLNNEGGEGYVPDVITQEMYDNAQKRIKNL